MIHLFNGSRRRLFFPKKWANSIVKWITGVHSPTGTVKIKNNLDPSDSGSIALDVNVEAVVADTLKRIDVRPLTVQERKRFAMLLRSLVDGNSIELRNGAHLSVSPEWVQDVCREVMSDQTTPGATVANLVVYQIYKPSGTTSHYWAVPITMEFSNGLLTSATAGTAFDLYNLNDANVPTIS